MQLQTQIPLKKEAGQIDYKSQLVLLGSCFITHIGEKLSYYKFQSIRNPFGILFHPLAIERVVERAMLQKEYRAEETFFLNEKWQCYDAHSELSTISQETLVEALNQGLRDIRKKIKNATHLCITLGTAWGYKNKETQLFVANCHKVPQQFFTKELLSVNEISNSINNILRNVRSANPKVRCIFTVSPVRHLKDGFIENQRSKAHLVTAIHQSMNEQTDTEDMAYFPSYELMMDELRDYRFYAADMVHPNTVAINYIWEKFKEVWVSETVFPIMDRIALIQKGLQHRPFNPESEEHLKFKLSLNEKIRLLQENYPFITFKS